MLFQLFQFLIFSFPKKSKKRKINFDTVAMLKFCERENEWHRLKLQEPHVTVKPKLQLRLSAKGQGTGKIHSL